MRCTSTNLFSLGLLLLSACEDGDATGSALGELQATESEFAGSDAGTPARSHDAGVRQLADGGPPAINLDCPRGGNQGPAGVVFACSRITVVTCKDLSNVVLDLADGSRQRFEGLSGHQNVFASSNGQIITGVWVKAGNNQSGDGPGYGQRFDAPATASCTDGGRPPQNPPSTSDACVPAPGHPCGTSTDQPPSSPPPSSPPCPPPSTPPSTPPPSTPPPSTPPSAPPSTPPSTPPPSTPPSVPPSNGPGWVD